METSVPLNRPELDDDPTTLLDGVNGPCKLKWRDFERFQEGFSVVKKFIENKYDGIILSINHEPQEKRIGITYTASSPYDYVGEFWKLKLSSKNKDMFEIDHILRDVSRMFKIIGIDLENTFELEISGYTVTLGSKTETDNMISTLSRYGITSHVYKKYNRKHLEKVSQKPQTNIEYVSRAKKNWFRSTLSDLKSLVGA
jgi:hypothetical protein